MIPQPPVPIPTPQKYDPTADTLTYTLLLWSHINKLRGKFGLHHTTHEPSGMDAIQMPLGGLVDVALGSTIADGAALVYNLAGTAWGAGTAATTSFGQAFFMAAGTIIPGGAPGPTNLSAASLTITRVLVQADAEVVGDVTAGGGFSFGSGGGSDDSVGLTYEWPSGGSLAIQVTSVGTPAPSYLTADVYFTR
jgi:hypothetical protein